MDNTSDVPFQSTSSAQSTKRKKINWLKFWRTKKGMTIQDLYKKSGISPSTISKLENNLAVANPTTVFKLAAALEIETNHLFSMTERPKANKKAKLEDKIEVKGGESSKPQK